MLVEVVDGDVPVFGHDEIQANEAGIGGGEFEAEHDLREDGFVRQAAQNLIKVADGDAASGFGVGGAAFQFGSGAGVVVGQGLAVAAVISFSPPARSVSRILAKSL